MDKHDNMEIAKQGLFFAIEWALVVYLGLTMAIQETVGYLKFLEMIVVTIGFFRWMHWICIMVENTPWYDNVKKEKEILLAQERIGAEPDPKDFENSP